MKSPISKCLWVLALLWCWTWADAWQAAELPSFNLTDADAAGQWQAAHDIASLQSSPEGLVVTISGSDPYFHGPARDYPKGQPLWVNLRVRSERGGILQVFYFDTHPSEEQSVRAIVSAGKWEQLRLPLPPLGKAYRLRIDPPGDGGKAVFSGIVFEQRVSLSEPEWPAAVLDAPPAPLASLKAGRLELAHAANGQWMLSFAGDRLAVGHHRLMIGYATQRQRWMSLEHAKGEVSSDGRALVWRAGLADQDGAQWTLIRRFLPGRLPDTIDVELECAVNQDRDVAFLPLLVLVRPGEAKTAALLPGLEYLDQDEPSSSEADVIGPGSKRQVPDSLKVTFPLMTVLADGNHIGLIWDRQPDVAAVFDSPDRLFRSGGHVMGLIYPGSDSANRVEGSLLPYGGHIIRANVPIKLRATIVAGQAQSVLPAVQQYVMLRGLPKVPDVGMDLPAYARMAAAGWLDSRCREDDRYRHAWPGQFQPNAVVDAAMMMDWLAPRVADEPTAGRLKEAARGALSEVPSAGRNSSGIGHVRYPVESLVYGDVLANVQRARATGRAMVKSFQPDGSFPYRPRAGAPDYSKTHFSKEANGLAAPQVAAVLEHAAVSGDAELIAEALRLLRAMDKFANTAPRGAQTWECPLHTPDILASAYLVRAYLLGYQLSGDDRLLGMARHWAWTGVPFVYLVNPADKPVGPYATIAVFGATNWVAPNWMGLPVQWCGMVYADSLYRLDEYDKSGPWKQLADGITASGIQQSFPIGSNADRVGMLPDSFVLRAQYRADPAINPATVQACAVRFFNQPALYDMHVFRGKGLIVHAPGEVLEAKEQGEGASFKVTSGWPAYRILVSGCKTRPRVRINGEDAAGEYDQPNGWLILQLQGDAVVEMR